MNIAIIDDLKEDGLLLCDYLKQYCDENKTLANIKNFERASDFLACFIPQVYDLIFVDIYMEGMNGIELAQKIREADKDCILIFSTTSTEHTHALAGYKVRAADYLIKPYDYNTFFETMQHCGASILEKNHFIEVKQSRRIIKILIRSILYTDYSNHYIYIYTKTGTVKTYMPFKAFSEMLLPYSNFICCYRNRMVNLDEVDFMENRDFIMSNGERIAISKSAYKEIAANYRNYQFEKINRLKR